MITTDEQLQIALDVLQRLKSEMTALGVAVEPAPGVPGYAPEAVAEPRPVTQPVPDLSALLRKIGPQPPCSALFGLCEDGLPFLIDLSDPRPGSVLISGDAKSGKTRLLQAMLASVCELNSADQVNYYLVTARPDESQSLARSPHCLGVLLPDERATGALIIDLAEVANQRRSSGETEPKIVLAIEDLESIKRYLDANETRYLQWLLEYGPKSGIWPVATLEAERFRKVEKDLLPGFGTRLIGKIGSPSLASYLSGYPDPVAETLEGGKQFCILFGSEWIRFWIPNLDS